MSKSIISFLTMALLTWELYGPTFSHTLFFELDASLPKPIRAAVEVPLLNPVQILHIPTPQPYKPIEYDAEPGMSDENEPTETPDKTDEPQEVTLRSPGGKDFLISGDVVIHNETSKTIDMDKVMSRKLGIELPDGSPQILIVHTHGGCEGYWDEGDVVGIGERLAELLTAAGFNVLHDKTPYDEGNFRNAYSNALDGIAKTLKENPSVQIVLDIHRDAIAAADGTVRKPVFQAGDEKAAQLMFVVGTNGTGLPHDNWPLNLSLAVHLQKILTPAHPDLMRSINLRRERFNQHATRGSLILEVGALGNNFSEALLSIELFAEGMRELFFG
ncbi:MAG: stage II sporulation protein P [Oscillospiraceae bacterium]|nr:stage II sporulation protein P [Oscillospiraceae bacterium]